MRYIFLLTCLLFFSACISNKKHQAAVATLQANHQSQVAELQSELDQALQTVTQRNLTIAERIGENNILLMLRDELTAKVEQLENQIETLNSNSNLSQKEFSSSISAKEKEIKRLRNLLDEVELTIAAKEALVRTMATQLDTVAEAYPTAIEVKPGFDYAIIEITEAFLFKKNSATRLTTEGFAALEKIAEVLQDYPRISVEVIGHTDTAPPRDKKRFGDNWNFSALQSATVVRTLIDDFGVSANQLMLAAKGEFAPRASNATAEGKLRNRRLELYVSLDSKDLAKDIRKVLSLKN